MRIPIEKNDIGLRMGEPLFEFMIKKTSYPIQVVDFLDFNE